MKRDFRRLAQALDVLTEGNLTVYPSRLRSARLQRELERFKRRHREWLRARGIVGFGVTRRLRRGRRTRGLVLVVYVRRKRPLPQVARPVPRTITVPQLGRFRTDVVELGEFSFHAFTTRIRPVQPGCSLGLTVGNAGTLGCVVRAGGATMLLSCAHVLTNRFVLPDGEPVEQPARPYQVGTAGHRVGVVHRCIPLDFNPDEEAFPNVADAGLVRIDDGVAADPTILLWGAPPAGIGVVADDMPVAMVGATSGRREGTVSDPFFKMALELANPAQPGATRRAGFSRLVLASYSASEGDSGALVLDASGRAVGLHMGAFPEGSVFCQLSLAAPRLGITI